MILKAFKFRLYPNKTQEVLLNKTFGCVRFVWNHNVEVFNDWFNNPERKALSVAELRQEYEWMKEVSACAVESASNNFRDFKTQYFNKKRKKKLGRPQFKNRNSRQSFKLDYRRFRLVNNRIRFEKIGFIKINITREIHSDAEFRSVTVSKNSAGQYFASILVRMEISNPIPLTGNVTGIDMGLNHFLTLSNGDKVSNPRFFRESQAKLRTAQKHLSRKKKGSSRYKKQKLKVARMHLKISNQRKNFLHSEANKILKDYDIIGIEDLNVEGMKKSHNLGKSISDASFSEFFRILSYKAEWNNKKVIKINRFYPSSKTCSHCGWYNPELKRGNRTFDCKACGISLDRDHNAALNIKEQALGMTNVIRTQNEQKTSSCIGSSL